MSSTIKALKKYQELICNFQKRNKELLYRPAPYSIGFSHLTLPKDFAEPAKVRSMFVAGNLSNEQFLSSLDKGVINLDDHFCLKYENLMLRRKINSIRLADDSYQKEFGISGAWFIGPFLMWKTKVMGGVGGIDNIFISPIFKNPVDIKKNKSKNDIIEFEDAQVFQVNTTLRILIKKEYGIDLEKEYFGTLKESLETVLLKIKEKEITVSMDCPESEILKIPPKTKNGEDENGNKIRIKIPLEEAASKADIELFKKVSTNHFVVQDVFYLDVFDASKMSLYYDYEDILQTNVEETNPLIAGLVDENLFADSFPGLDSKCEKSNFYVVDIDGSQHKAIKSCRTNQGFVIQGPPGTGKSQTITNLISQLLAEGKKVLFVAEKRAALDVVYSRLSSTGLGKHSVILHDNEVNKNALYKSYVQAFSEKVDHTIGTKWIDIGESLNYQSQNVAKYFQELSESPDYTSLTNFEFLSHLSGKKKFNLDNSVYRYVGHLSLSDFEKGRSILLEGSDLYRNFGRYEESYWRTFNKSSFVNEVLIKDLEEKSKSFTMFETDFNRSRLFLEKTFPNSLYEKMNLINIEPLNVTDFDIASEMVNNCFRSANAKNMLLELNDKVNELKSKLSSFKLIKNDANEEVMLTLKEYFKKPKSFLKYLSFKYWKMKSLAQTVIEDKGQIENHYVYNDWLVFTQFEKEISNSVKIVYKAIQLSFKDKESQIKGIDDYLRFSDTVLKIKSLIGGDRFANEFISESIESLVVDFKKSVPVSETFLKSKNCIVELKKEIDQYFESELENDAFLYGQILSMLIVSKDDLVPVQHIKEKIKEIEKVFRVSDFHKKILFFEEKKYSWTECLEYHLMLVLRDKIFTDFPSVRSFASYNIEAEIAKLNSLFEVHKNLSRSAVDYKVFSEREKTTVPPKIFKMIENEANKTRRIKSPREVMENGALDVMLAWKRCWLMSPLSISQILPNTSNLFDVVIFDEASQVKIEDAIPSIYRAKSLIVVGDNKQMPPTNFFGSAVDDEDEDIEIPESLLDQAIKKYPSLMLEWHYRSEAESLIAFSNYAYYARGLVVPPNPGTLCSSNAIEFVSVENGVFDSSNGNEIEAGIIVKKIREILVENPKASLGVITMGMSQQRAINKILDELCENDEAFNKAYNFSLNYYEDGSYKGIFNRNLENVQGDERDFIILSVGYGANKDGKFRKAFGPLSLDGGGRRLNVAITRARKKMTVFCSFDPSELSSDNDAFMRNPNTTTFARFLSYSKAVSENNEEGALAVLRTFTDKDSQDADSETFVNIIADELEKVGYRVRKKVGSCGFTIDIGVFNNSKDEDFILGIDINKGVRGEVSFLRDSFKNRKALLKNRGWEIYTLWQQDWIDNKDKILDEISSALRQHNDEEAIS